MPFDSRCKNTNAPPGYAGGLAFPLQKHTSKVPTGHAERISHERPNSPVPTGLRSERKSQDGWQALPKRYVEFLHIEQMYVCSAETQLLHSPEQVHAAPLSETPLLQTTVAVLAWQGKGERRSRTRNCENTEQNRTKSTGRRHVVRRYLGKQPQMKTAP